MDNNWTYLDTFEVVTGNTGADIQTAIDTGRPVLIPAGTYTGTFVCDNDNQLIVGQGLSTILDASGVANGIRITGDNVTVKNIKVINAQTYGLYALDCVSPVIDNITVVDSGNIGIFYELSTVTAAIEGPQITNCTVDRSALGSAIVEGGIKIHGLTSYPVLRSKILNNTVTLPSDAVNDEVICIESFMNSDRASIIGNTVSGGYMGISLAQADYNTITGNTIYNANIWGIEVAGSDYAAVQGNTIDGNTNTSIGIIVSAINTIYSNHTAITGNTISGCTNHGIQLGSTNDGLTITGNTINHTGNYGINLIACENWSITGNELEGNSTAKKAIMLDRSDNGVISGNSITNFTENGVLFYGTSAANDLNEVSITGNRFYNCNSTINTDLTGGAVIGNSIKIIGNVGLDDYLDYKNNVKQITGTGTPEGTETGGIGSIFYSRDGVAGQILYEKTTATSNTGWDSAPPMGTKRQFGICKTLTSGNTTTANINFNSTNGWTPSSVVYRVSSVNASGGGPGGAEIHYLVSHVLTDTTRIANTTSVIANSNVTVSTSLANSLMLISTQHNTLTGSVGTPLYMTVDLEVTGYRSPTFTFTSS